MIRHFLGAHFEVPILLMIVFVVGFGNGIRVGLRYREHPYAGLEGQYQWNGAIYTLDRAAHSKMYMLCASDRFRSHQPPTCVMF